MIFGAFVLIWGTLIMIFGAFVLIWGTLIMICGAFVLIWGTLIMIFGAFVLIWGTLIMIFGAFVFIWGALIMVHFGIEVPYVGSSYVLCCAICINCWHHRFLLVCWTANSFLWLQPCCTFTILKKIFLMVSLVLQIGCNTCTFHTAVWIMNWHSRVAFPMDVE